MIYDDFSKLEEFYKLLMNLNHELQMSLKIKACTSARARWEWLWSICSNCHVPKVSTSIAFNDGLQSVCKSDICKTPKQPKKLAFLALNLPGKYVKNIIYSKHIELRPLFSISVCSSWYTSNKNLFIWNAYCSSPPPHLISFQENLS